MVIFCGVLIWIFNPIPPGMFGTPHSARGWVYLTHPSILRCKHALPTKLGVSLVCHLSFHFISPKQDDVIYKNADVSNFLKPALLSHYWNYCFFLWKTLRSVWHKMGTAGSNYTKFGLKACQSFKLKVTEDQPSKIYRKKNISKKPRGGSNRPTPGRNRIKTI